MSQPIIENIDPGQPNLQEVAVILQRRFPREWEIAMLEASNLLLRQRLHDSEDHNAHTGDNEEADDVG